LRSYDFTADARLNDGMPLGEKLKGIAPVRSYLAVPMVSASGAILGGLFFGHEQAGAFSEREEQLLAGLAAQAAVAMDNARLFQDAKLAVQTRDEFLRIASHELKTPLTPLKLHMQGLSRLLKKGRDIEPERLVRMAETADQQIGRLNRLVEDLLDVSRISAGLLTLNPEEFNLAELVRETAERNRPVLSAAGMGLSLKLRSTVWGTFDHLRLEQVLANLLTNALKYAPGSNVEVSLTDENGQAVLTVADLGPGISAADAEKVFDRFERVGETGRSVTGLGLGLYITRQIVEAHGGRISVEPNEPRGARFVLKIPMANSTVALAPPPCQETPRDLSH
jgi:signal transduction histidine kinase